MTDLLRRAKGWARDIKRDVLALWLAARDPRVPAAAKILAGVVAAYALSPVDLIPDFMPVLGYLDDVILVPLGILATVRLIPPAVMTDLRNRASLIAERPVSRAGLFAIVALWIAAAGFAGWAVMRLWSD